MRWKAGGSQLLRWLKGLAGFMKDYSIKNLRNVGLMGHNGTGKTSLAESILYYSKITDRLGKIEDGTTVLDFDTEEKKRQFSIKRIQNFIKTCIFSI